MKFSTNTDFTKLPRAGAYARAADAAGQKTVDSVVLEHDERHLRRRVLALGSGGQILVDLPEPVLLADGDLLLLEDGRAVKIRSAEEELYEVRPGAIPLRHLAWHLGNRHLAAQIDEDRILIRRDHVIKAMLEGLGATVAETTGTFQPVHGAYHNHGHQHEERDKFGRAPGDPHYGHNHA